MEKLLTLFKDNFARNVLMLMTGTAFSHTLLFATSPLISRAYSPSAFGIFSIYTAIITLFAAIISLRYELTIILPKNEEDALTLTVLSLTIVSLLSALTLLAVVFSRHFFAAVLKVPDSIFWWIPASTFGFGVTQVLRYWNTRKKRFGFLSVTEMTRSITTTAVQLIGSIFGAYALIGGKVFGDTINMFQAIRKFLKHDLCSLKASFSRHRINTLARQYVAFPLYGTPQALFNSLSQQLPIFLLTIYFGVEVAGLYALANRILVTPTYLVAEPIQQVFLQEASELHNSGINFLPNFVKLTVFLFFIAIGPCLIIMAFGESFFRFFFGEHWSMAGKFCSVLIIWTLMSFINAPSTATLTVYQLNKFSLFYGIVSTIFRTSAIILGGYFHDVMLSLFLFSITGALSNLFLILYVGNTISKRNREQRRHIQAS